MADTITIEDGFCHKLGLFVIQFAHSEGMLFLFLSLLLGIGKDECNAITSGAKVDGCSNYIKRIYEARGLKVPNDISSCLDQFAIINKLRNDILHKGVSNTGIVSSYVRSMPNRVEEFAISNKMLDQGTADLYKITMTLAIHHSPIQGTNDEVSRIQTLLARPWQYKQPQPANTRQTTQSKTQKQQRLPEPSQE